MNMTRFFPLFVGVVALATLGCQELPTTYTAPELAASLDYTNGPASPGNGHSAVLRSQFSVDFLTWEETGGDDLLAYHIQGDDIFFCGGNTGLPVFDHQEVATPAGIMRAVSRLDGAGIAIYRPADFFAAAGAGFGPFCTFISDEWLYRGTHDFVIRGILDDGSVPGPTFGWSANGHVTDPSGKRFRYSERATYLVTDFGPQEIVFDISVH